MGLAIARFHFRLVKAAALAALTCTLGLFTPGTAKAQITDSKIQAVYKVYYNGMELGHLDFNSTIEGRKYELESDTNLKVPLLGSIFESLRWRGITRTSGVISHNQPKPRNYHFDFRNDGKAGTIDMDFKGNSVSRVELNPDKKMPASFVAVKPHHLRNVMDPMSAVMLINRTGDSHRSACDRSIPIFDGLQRFNLALSYKRAVRVSQKDSGGYAGPVIVCRVRYEPISGYKPNKDIEYMAKNRDIELWLMPLPNSRNYAPYRFVLPLPIGTADADLAYFNIHDSGGRKIALVKQ